MWPIHIIEYYSALKRSERSSLVVLWLKDLVLSLLWFKSLLWRRLTPGLGTSACCRHDHKKEKKKRIKHWHMLQCGQTLKTWYSVKQARHKRPHVCDSSDMKYPDEANPETESVLVDAWSWEVLGRTERDQQTWLSFGDDENVLGLDSGNCYTALWLG